MLTEEKIKQLRKKIRSGEPEGEIKNKLRSEGYTDEDMKEVFVTPRPDMRNWCLFFAVLFLLIGLYQFFVNLSWLFLLFSAGMFFAYYQEVKRIKKSSP